MANEREHNEFVADMREILAETVEVSAEPVLEAEGAGADLERKAREKRKKKTKHLGAGRNPFKHKDRLGLGPRGKRNAKSGKWKCSCRTPYMCKCKSGSRNKTIRIGRAYKKSYNHEYKAWRKGQHKAQG